MDDDARRALWDERYATRDHPRSEPHPAVERIVGDLPPGTAVDLGSGAGRHALWLAERGWRVTAVDFSSVGLALGEQVAQARELSIDWVVADARAWAPEGDRTVDLVLVSHLHLTAEELARTARWLSPGGQLVVVAHGERNLTVGTGGPSDPDLLYSLEELRAAASGLDVHRCEELTRRTAKGDVVEALLVARRQG